LIRNEAPARAGGYERHFEQLLLILPTRIKEE
jgi:hypothetical protein